MALSATERTLRAQIAANTSWGLTTDRAARTAPARDRFNQRFLDQADGDPLRAESLRLAYFQRLALKSVKARRRKREALS